MYASSIGPENKMSIGWVYRGMCCPVDAAPQKWVKRLKRDNAKHKTLRDHRSGRG